MKHLLLLDADDCLTLADLLRSRIAVMSKQKMYPDDTDPLLELEKKFRALSKETSVDYAVIKLP